VLSTAILAACGGGGSADEPAAGPTPLALTGVAATGAAISGQTVEAKCSSGTGTATRTRTAASPSRVTGVSCLRPEDHARHRPALYSVATGTGSSATANISPVTHLVVASLTGGDPAAFFTAFDATAAASVTDAQRRGRGDRREGRRCSAPVSTSARSTCSPGRSRRRAARPPAIAYDQALDALAAKLDRRHHARHWTTTVAAASPAAPPTAPAATTASPPCLPTCCSSPRRAIARRCAAAAIAWCFPPRAAPWASRPARSRSMRRR
jgi:hypothetical protein